MAFYQRYDLSFQSTSLWQEFLDTNFYKGSTINYITSPFSDPALFPILIFIFAIASFLVLIAIKRDFTRQALVKASIFSFMLAGVLFALRMDVNWFVMLKNDYAKFSGRDIDDRVVAAVGFDLKHFMNFTRRVIPEGEKVREVEINPYDLTFILTKLGNYYLLPTVTSNRGRFVWVYDFTDYSYDPATGALRYYDLSFKARLYAIYRQGAYVYEIVDDE